MLVGIDGDRLATLLHFDGHDLVLELAGGDGGVRALLRAHGDFVLRLARDFVLLGEVLGGDAHVLLAEGVAEEVEDAVFEDAVAHPVAVAALADVVRHHRHVLGAAGDDDLGIAGLDVARRGVDRFQAAAADAVDGDGGRLDRHAGLDGGVARDIAVFHHLTDAAEDDVVHLFGLEARALDCGADGDGAEIRCREVRVGALELPDGRPRAANDHDIFHNGTSAPYLRWVRTL